MYGVRNPDRRPAKRVEDITNDNARLNNRWSVAALNDLRHYNGDGKSGGSGRGMAMRGGG